MKFGIGSRVQIKDTELTDALGLAVLIGEIVDIDSYAPFTVYQVDIGMKRNPWLSGQRLRGIPSHRNKEDKDETRNRQ